MMQLFQELKIKGEQPTTNLITLIMVLYVIFSCILLLNMLIAILGSTFSRVIDNCDIEWKYAQSKLLKVIIVSKIQLSSKYINLGLIKSN